MSEQTTETTQTEAQEATGADEPFDAERAKEKIAKQNSEAANLRKRLRELEPLAQRAQELEEAGKSEAQRLTERAEGAEKALTPLQQENARLKVALAKGVPADLIDRLRGDTPEEIEADADALLALVARPGAEPARQSLDLGSRGQSAAGGADMNTMLRRATGRS